ncbi:MAG: hypothetical protein ACHQF3_04325 [Alphaproteobacteria bacterium]
MPAEPRLHPFPGLRPFETDEEYLFFGREGQSEEILRRLRRNRFLAVVGTSGSGKSSLIRAGLLTYLYGGFLAKAGSHWRVAMIRPGSDPIGNLAHALTDGAGRGAADANAEDAARNAVLLEVTLRRSGLGLIEATRLARLAAHENVLVIVDQFEELFRYADAAGAPRREGDADAFVKLLLEASRQSELPIYVVLTMRSDFIGDCARFRDLPEAVTAGLFLIPRMTRDQRRAAIEEPVRVAGAEISRRLVNRLLNDVGDNPDQLPILQHALMRSWDYWSARGGAARPLDLEDYTAIGGMAEALSLHADEAFAGLPDEQHRQIARRVFQCLTEKGADNRETRRPTMVSTIALVAGVEASEVIAIVEEFRRPGRSFLTPPAEGPLAANSVIDISHESLIRGWRRLKGWVEEEAESARVYRRLAETAELRAAGQAGLWHDPDLAHALAWRAAERPNAAWGERYHAGFAAAMAFLEESRVARDAELAAAERRRNEELRRARRLTYAASAALVVFALLGGFAWWQMRQAEEQRRVAEQQTRVAEQQTGVAERQTLFAEQQRKAAEEQRKLAEDEKRQAEEKQQEATLAAEDLRVEARRSGKQLISDQQTIAAMANTLLNNSVPEGTLYPRRRKVSALTQMGDHEGAIAQLDVILAADPQNLKAIFDRGYEYLLVGRPEEAIRDIRKYLDTRQEWNAYGNLAIAEAMRRNYDAAVDAIRQSIAHHDPTDLDIYDSEVAPDIQEATRHTILWAESASFFVALHYELAVLYAFSGDSRFAKALDDANEQDRKYQGSTEAYLLALNWAWLDVRAQRRDEKGELLDYGVFAAKGALWERAAVNRPRYNDWARQSYQEFQKAYAERPQPRYAALADWVAKRLASKQLGTAEKMAGEVADPRELELLAEELESRTSGNDPMSHAEAQRNFTAGIDLLEKEAAGKDDRRKDLLIALHLRRGQLRLDVDDRKGARDDAARVIALDETVSEAHRLLARTAFDDRSRRDAYEKALMHDAANVDALQDYADLLSKTKSEPQRTQDVKRALALLETRLHMTVAWSADYEQIARLQLQLGEMREALASVNSAIALDPGRADLYLLRRSAEEGLGRSERSVALHLAAGYRAAGDALARNGRYGAALALYLRGIRTAAARPNPDDDEGRFEIEAAIRTVSDFLMTRYSEDYARQFWRSIASSAFMASRRGRFEAEAHRLEALR